MITLFTINGRIDIYCAIEDEVVTLTQCNLRDIYWGEEIVIPDDSGKSEYIIHVREEQLVMTHADTSKAYSCDLPWELNSLSLKEAYLSVNELRTILEQETTSLDDHVYLRNHDGSVVQATSIGVSSEGRQECSVASSEPVYVLYVKEGAVPLTVKDLQRITARPENFLITFSDENSLHVPVDLIDTDYESPKGTYNWLIGASATR